jgi:cytoskeletal protein RodZ
MYEQNEVPVFRRILWIVLWFVVIVAVIWVLVWLIFFRHSSPKATKSHTPQTSQNQPAAPSSPKTATGSGTAPTGSSPAPTAGQGNPSPSSTGTAAPSQLANTGAGDVIVPFVVASAAGSALYYVRLRKKLQA